MQHVGLLFRHLHFCDGDRAANQVANVLGAFGITEIAGRTRVNACIDPHLVRAALQGLQHFDCGGGASNANSSEIIDRKVTDSPHLISSFDGLYCRHQIATERDGTRQLHLINSLFHSIDLT